MRRIASAVFSFLLLCILPAKGQEQNSTVLHTDHPESVIKNNTTDTKLNTEQELALIRRSHESALKWMDQKEFDKAIHLYLSLARQYGADQRYREQMITVYANISNVYLIKNNYTEAMDFAIKAVETAEQIPQQDFKIYSKEENIARLANNISGLMTHLKEYDKALLYLNKAEAVARKLQRDSVLITILVNKGGALTDLKRNTEAIEVLREVINLVDHNDIKAIKAIALSNLVHIYTEIENYGKAITYLEELEAMTPYLDEEMRGQTMLQKGDIYLQRKQYTDALHYLQKCLAFAKGSKITKLEHNAHDALIQLYTRTGEYKKALEHQSIYIKLHDSLYNTDVTNATRELEARYHIAQKDKALAESQLDIDRQKTSIIYRNIGIGVTLAGLTFISLLFYSNRRTARNKQRLLIAELESSRQKEELLQSRNEVEQFRSMMLGEEKERSRLAGELHDGIISRLSAIKMNLASAIKRNNSPAEQDNNFPVILKQLAEATEELRRTSHNLMPEALLHRGLESALRTFCTQMDQLFTGRIHFYVFGELENIEMERQLAVYRMVQELVQNAIKHAQANHIVVQLSYQDNMLGITVEDNGKGLPQETNALQGIGLAHLRMKVEAFNGKMEVSSSAESGTSVYIGLNWES